MDYKTHTHTLIIVHVNEDLSHWNRLDRKSCSWLWKPERKHSCGAKTGLLFPFLTPWFFLFLYIIFLFGNKKKLTWGFQVDSPRSPQWRRFILLSVAIYTHICVYSSCCCCCFSALLIIILFHGQSWILFPPPCCLLCRQFTVQS